MDNKDTLGWIWAVFGLPVLSMIIESNMVIVILFFLILIVIFVIESKWFGKWLRSQFPIKKSLRGQHSLKRNSKETKNSKKNNDLK